MADGVGSGCTDGKRQPVGVGDVEAVVEGDGVVTRRCEMPGHPVADEAATAGHEHPHPVNLTRRPAAPVAEVPARR